MDWTARLAEKRAEKPERSSCLLTKPTKPPFVSFDSKPGGHFENLSASFETTTCDRMLVLSADEYGDPALVLTLSESFLRDCEGMADDALRALLSMLRDNADRRAGRAPAGDTAAIICQACGPVFVHPSIAAVLPVVNGWPRALGCPWCFIRKAGLYVPRPPVTCASCRYFQPDTINPAQGMGRCTVDAARPQAPPTYPSASRHCGSWRPTEPDDD